MEILGAGSENAKGWLGPVEVAVKSPRRNERGKAPGQGPDHCGGGEQSPWPVARGPCTEARGQRPRDCRRLWDDWYLRCVWEGANLVISR